MENRFPTLLTPSGNMRPKKRITSLWLATYPQEHLYFCPDCKNPIFGYQGEVVLELPGMLPMGLPVSIMCRNANCGRTVRIEAFVASVL